MNGLRSKNYSCHFTTVKGDSLLSWSWISYLWEETQPVGGRTGICHSDISHLSSSRNTNLDCCGKFFLLLLKIRKSEIIHLRHPPFGGLQCTAKALRKFANETLAFLMQLRFPKAIWLLAPHFLSHETRFCRQGQGLSWKRAKCSLAEQSQVVKKIKSYFPMWANTKG